MVQISMLAVTALHCLASVRAGETPSCETDIVAHCLGDDADMSPGGIQACLLNLVDRSALCNEYLTIVGACSDEIGKGGICEGDHKEGDTMPCLIHRTKPDDLSVSCHNTLPVEEVKTGLKDTVWKNGKVLLFDHEIAKLDANDADTYERWVKKKNKNKKSAHGKDKDYAILKMKQDKAKQKLAKDIISSLLTEAARALNEDSVSDVKESLTKQVKRKVKEAKKAGVDAGSFEKDDVKDVVKKIMKAAKQGQGSRPRDPRLGEVRVEL